MARKDACGWSPATFSICTWKSDQICEGKKTKNRSSKNSYSLVLFYKLSVILVKNYNSFAPLKLCLISRHEKKMTLHNSKYHNWCKCLLNDLKLKTYLLQYPYSMWEFFEPITSLNNKVTIVCIFLVAEKIMNACFWALSLTLDMQVNLKIFESQKLQIPSMEVT